MRFSYFLWLLLSLSVSGQEIQWASKILKCSSDLGSKAYGSKRMLGKPDVFPQGGVSPNAWSPKNALDGKEAVEVAFDKPQTVKQIAIFENVNAGCVVRISVDTGTGNYETVWTRKKDWKTPTFKATMLADHAYYFKRKRRKLQDAPDILNPGIEHAILEQSVSNVVAVKVEFNFALLPGPKQIDAIGISDATIPLEATINVGASFQNLPNPEVVETNDFDVVNCAVSDDGATLFFTANDGQKEQIYSATKSANGKWSTPILQTALSENDTYNYLEFCSNQMLLKAGNEYNKETGTCGYQWFQNNAGTFEAKEQLKIAAYANYGTTSDATATLDLKKLIFAIESDFTQGGTDLYFCNQKEAASYGLLQNMGKGINSSDDEITPQLLSDTKTLLFSSNGFSGFGNFDLYVSYRLDDTWKNWSEPINLGSKINGEGSECAPFYDEKNQLLYFTKSGQLNTRLMVLKISKLDVMKQ